jgi:hypothetical protein
MLLAYSYREAQRCVCGLTWTADLLLGETVQARWSQRTASMTSSVPADDSQPNAVMRRDRRWRRAFIISWTLAAAAIILWAAYQQLRPLPSVRYRSAADAVVILRSHGFANVDASQVASDSTVGLVTVSPDVRRIPLIGDLPGFNDRVLTVARLTLRSRKPGAPVTVPNILGWRGLMARYMLGTYGLAAQEVTLSPNAGFVASQSPSPGATARTGQSVTLYMAQYHGQERFIRGVPTFRTSHAYLVLREGAAGCVGQCHKDCRPCHTGKAINDNLDDPRLPGPDYMVPPSDFFGIDRFSDPPDWH